MRLRRYFVVAAAVGAFAVIGVLAYAMLFSQGHGPDLGNQVPWLGHKEASTGPAGQTQPVGSKGDTPPDGGTDAGTATPELPSGMLLLIGAVPVGAGMLLLERRRSRAERR